MKHSFAQIPAFEITKGFKAKFVHTDSMTLAMVEVEEGALLPLHHHVHEQITTILEGKFEMQMSGETHLLEPGSTFTIPSNEPHSGRALTGCRILDVFSPVREDFRRGKVAYAVR